MDKISVTLEICTLYHGLPHGIALITYTNPDDKWSSFRGLGIFNNGKLHNAPFTSFNGNGWGRLLSKMENGRPADESYLTYFYLNTY
jgi:hypothetical protein